MCNIDNSFKTILQISLSIINVIRFCFSIVITVYSQFNDRLIVLSIFSLLCSDILMIAFIIFLLE